MSKTKLLNRIVSVFLVIAVLFVLHNFVAEKNGAYIKYMARMGTYVISSKADALIIRNETVMEPSVTGVMKPEVSEGERVSAYSRLGAVITGEIAQNKLNEINVLNKEIESLSSSVSESGILSIPEDKVDSTLNLSIGSLRYSAAKNDIGEAVAVAENIRVLTERKAGVTTSSTAMQKMEELTRRRDAIVATMGGAHKALYAPHGGVYSGNMDGLETVLTRDILKNLTPEGVDGYFEKVGTTTATGPCKVINNYKWYLIFNLPEEECGDLVEGREYTVIFYDQNDLETTGKILSVSEADGEGRCAVAMQFDKYMEKFIDTRFTSIELRKMEYSGIYIPRSAVTVEDVQGVWVQNEITPVFRSIVEVYRDDEFLLVKENAEGIGGHNNIALYDNIILNWNESPVEAVE